MDKIARDKEEFNACYYRTVDTVYRVCKMYFKGNVADIEDAVQTTYLNLLKSRKCFENERHEKAYIIVTASNVCKNILKHWWRKNADIESIKDLGIEDDYESNRILDLLNKLPSNIRIAMYMHYYEGFNGAEIADTLKKKESTIWGYLHRGRDLLKRELEGRNDE